MIHLLGDCDAFYKPQPLAFSVVIQMNAIVSPMKLPLFALAFTLMAVSGTPVAAEDTSKVLFEDNFSGQLGPG